MITLLASRATCAVPRPPDSRSAPAVRCPAAPRRVEGLRALDRGAAIVGDLHLVQRLEDPRERFCRVLVVVHDEHAAARLVAGLGRALPPETTIRSGLREESGSRTVNVAPWPRPSLATCTVPPCRRVSSRTRVSPRPRPPLVRSSDSSPCTNMSKTRPSNSDGMPTPWSCTVSTASPASASSQTFTWLPDALNFKALDSRLSTICVRRTRSPSTQSGSRGSSHRTDWLR